MPHNLQITNPHRRHLFIFALLSTMLLCACDSAVSNTISKLEKLPVKVDKVEVWAVDFNPKATLIAIGSNFKVDVWDWQRRRLVVTLPLPAGVNPQLDANAVQFSPDGSLLAILVDGAPERLVVRVLSTKDWTIAKDIRDDKTVRVVGLAFTPDTKYLLTANDMVGSAGDSLTTYDINTGAPVWGLNLGRHFRALAIAVSPNGKSVAITGELTILAPPEVKDVSERIRQTRRKMQLHMVDLATRSVVRSIDCEACWRIAWSADSDRLAIVGNSVLEIYDANTTARMLHSSETAHVYENVRVSPDGHFIIANDALGTGLGFQIWDSSGKRLLTSVRGNVSSIAVSANSGFLAAGQDDHVTIWQLH